VGRAAEGEKLAQRQVVRLELRPVNARHVDQVQIGAAEGPSGEDAAVHRQDHGAMVGDARGIPHADHLDRRAARAVKMQLP